MIWQRIEWRHLRFLEGLPALAEYHPEAWSRPRRRRGRRPHEMQETWLMCVLLVLCMFNNWLFNRGGAGVLVSKCSYDVFPFAPKNALPVPMLTQVSISLQSRALMEVKRFFSQKHRVFSFPQRRFTRMGAIFPIRIEFPCR